MTDNEIIKTLECCINNKCSNCPQRKMACSETVAMENALDLINRQKAEIERLKSYKNLYEDLKAENLETIKAIKNCKAEAIREFAERLCKGRVSNDPVVIAVKVELKGRKENG